MKYTELNLKINKEKNIVVVNDKQIEVLQYLPIEDKIDLIDIALQKSFINGVYNEMLLDAYFYLYIIFMYTNLEFTEEEKANELELYNQLESSGAIIDILAGMDEDEYEYLETSLKTAKEAREKYGMSAAALLQSFIQDMPQNATAAADIVNNFDKDKYKEVVEFAQYANGGRPI